MMLEKYPKKIWFKTVCAFLVLAVAAGDISAYADTAVSSDRLRNAFVGAIHTEGADRLGAPERGELPLRIDIPPELGNVVERHEGASGKQIIFVQDAHDSLEAQLNISKIISRLVEDSGVKTVFEEGYEGPVPTDEYFGSIKDPQVKEKVSYFLLDKLRIGGAEYAHINRKKDFKLIGADNVKLHLANISSYQKSSRQKVLLEKDLAVLKNEIDQLANRHFPSEMKEWVKLKVRYDAGELDVVDYVKRLRGFLGDDPSSSISSSPRPPKSIGWAGPPLAEKRGSARFGSPIKAFGDDEFVGAIHELPLRFFAEIRRLESRITRTFLTDKTAQKIFSYQKSIGLLERLSRIQMTPGEFIAVRRVLKEIDTEEIARFIVDQTRKPIALSKRWEKSIRSAVEFYETALKRDGILGDRLNSFISSRKENTAILVFGGFHRMAIEQILKAKNLSYSVVTPRITSVSVKHQGYYKRLMSAGRHAFEMPLFVRTASRPEVLFEMQAGFGKAYVRALEQSVRASDLENEANVSNPLFLRRVESGFEEILSVPGRGFGAEIIQSFQDIKRLDTDYGFFGSYFIFSNEEKREEAIETLGSFPARSAGIHFGVGGWFNLDIAAARRSPYVVLIDVNARMGKMYEMLSSSILDERALDTSSPVSERRKAFKTLFAEKIVQGGVYVDSNVEPSPSVRFLHALLNDQLHTKGGWLSDDHAFTHIQKLFQEDRIIFVRLDLTETEAFQAISLWMRREGLRTDTVYVSNVFEWISKKVMTPAIPDDEIVRKQHRFVESLTHIADRDTLLIEAYPALSVKVSRFDEAILRDRIPPLLGRRTGRTGFGAAEETTSNIVRVASEVVDELRKQPEWNESAGVLNTLEETLWALRNRFDERARREISTSLRELRKRTSPPNSKWRIDPLGRPHPAVAIGAGIYKDKDARNRAMFYASLAKLIKHAGVDKIESELVASHAREITTILSEVTRTLHLPVSPSAGFGAVTDSSPFDLRNTVHHLAGFGVAAKPTRPPRRVLIVENDEPSAIFYMDVIAKRFGLKTEHFLVTPTAEKAMKFMEEFKDVDLVLLDNDLDDDELEGHQIIPLLRFSYPEAVIIFNSARTDLTEAVRSKRLTNFITFPKLSSISPDELNRLLSDFFGTGFGVEGKPVNRESWIVDQEENFLVNHESRFMNDESAGFGAEEDAVAARYAAKLNFQADSYASYVSKLRRKERREFESHLMREFARAVKDYAAGGDWRTYHAKGDVSSRIDFIKRGEPLTGPAGALAKNGFYESEKYFINRIVRRFVLSKVLAGPGEGSLAPVYLNAAARHGTNEYETRSRVRRLMEDAVHRVTEKFYTGKVRFDDIVQSKWGRVVLRLNTLVSSTSLQVAFMKIILPAFVALALFWAADRLHLREFVRDIRKILLELALSILVVLVIVKPAIKRLQSFLEKFERRYYERLLDRYILGFDKEARQRNEKEYRADIEKIRKRLPGKGSGNFWKRWLDRKILTEVEKIIFKGLREKEKYVKVGKIGEDLAAAEGIAVDIRTVSAAMLQELADQNPKFFARLVKKWQKRSKHWDGVRPYVAFGPVRWGERSFTKKSDALADLVPLIAIQQNEPYLQKRAEEEARAVLFARAARQIDEHSFRDEVKSRRRRLLTAGQREFDGLFADHLYDQITSAVAWPEDRRLVILSYFLGAVWRLKYATESLKRGERVHSVYIDRLRFSARVHWPRVLNRIRSNASFYGLEEKEVDRILGLLETFRIRSVAESLEETVLAKTPPEVFEGITREVEGLVKDKSIPDPDGHVIIDTQKYADPSARPHWDRLAETMQAGPEIFEELAGMVHEAYLGAMRSRVDSESPDREAYQRSHRVDARLFDRTFNVVTASDLIAMLARKDALGRPLEEVEIFLGNLFEPNTRTRPTESRRSRLKLFHLEAVQRYLAGKGSESDVRYALEEFYRLGKRVSNVRDLHPVLTKVGTLQSPEDGVTASELKKINRLKPLYRQLAGKRLLFNMALADRAIKNLLEPERIEIVTLEAQIESVRDSMVTVVNPLSVPWDYLVAQLTRFGEDADERKKWLISLQETLVGVVGLLHDRTFFGEFSSGTHEYWTSHEKDTDRGSFFRTFGDPVVTRDRIAVVKLRKLLRFNNAIWGLSMIRPGEINEANHTYDWIAEHSRSVEMNWAVLAKVIRELGLDADERFSDVLKVGDEAARKQAAGMHGQGTLSDAIRTTPLSRGFGSGRKTADRESGTVKREETSSPVHDLAEGSVKVGGGNASSKFRIAKRPILKSQSKSQPRAKAGSASNIYDLAAEINRERLNGAASEAGFGANFYGEDLPRDVLEKHMRMLEVAHDLIHEFRDDPLVHKNYVLLAAEFRKRLRDLVKGDRLELFFYHDALEAVYGKALDKKIITIETVRSDEEEILITAAGQIRKELDERIRGITHIGRRGFLGLSVGAAALYGPLAPAARAVSTFIAPDMSKLYKAALRGPLLSALGSILEEFHLGKRGIFALWDRELGIRGFLSSPERHLVERLGLKPFGDVSDEEAESIKTDNLRYEAAIELFRKWKEHAVEDMTTTLLKRHMNEWIPLLDRIHRSAAQAWQAVGEPFEALHRQLGALMGPVEVLHHQLLETLISQERARQRIKATVERIVGPLHPEALGWIPSIRLGSEEDIGDTLLENEFRKGITQSGTTIHRYGADLKRDAFAVYKRVHHMLRGLSPEEVDRLHSDINQGKTVKDPYEVLRRNKEKRIRELEGAIEKVENQIRPLRIAQTVIEQDEIFHNAERIVWSNEKPGRKLNEMERKALTEGTEEWNRLDEERQPLEKKLKQLREDKWTTEENFKWLEELAAAGFGADDKRTRPFADPDLRNRIETVLYFQPDANVLGAATIRSSLAIHAVRSTFPNLKQLWVATTVPAMLVGESGLSVISLPRRSEFNSSNRQYVKDAIISISNQIKDPPDLVIVDQLYHLTFWPETLSGRQPSPASILNSPILRSPLIYRTGFWKTVDPALWIGKEKRWHILSTDHQFDNRAALYKAQLAASGFEWPRAEKYFDPSETLLARGREILSQTLSKSLDKPVVVVNPHGNFYREFHFNAAWVHLITELLANKNLDVVITSGTAGNETDTKRLEDIRQALAAAGHSLENHVLAPLNVGKLKSVLAASDYLVSLQSGPAHLADALGKPTIIWAVDSFGDGYLRPDQDLWRVVVVGVGDMRESKTPNIFLEKIVRRTLENLHELGVPVAGFGVMETARFTPHLNPPTEFFLFALDPPDIALRLPIGLDRQLTFPILRPLSPELSRLTKKPGLRRDVFIHFSKTVENVYENWATQSQGIKNIRDALPLYAPHLWKDYEAYRKDPESFTPEALHQLKERVYGITSAHLLIWGLGASLGKRAVPYFNGSYIEALKLSLSALDPAGFGAVKYSETHSSNELVALLDQYLVQLRQADKVPSIESLDSHRARVREALHNLNQSVKGIMPGGTRNESALHEFVRKTAAFFAALENYAADFGADLFTYYEFRDGYLELRTLLEERFQHSHAGKIGEWFDALAARFSALRKQSPHLRRSVDEGQPLRMREAEVAVSEINTYLRWAEHQEKFSRRDHSRFLQDALSRPTNYVVAFKQPQFAARALRYLAPHFLPHMKKPYAKDIISLLRHLMANAEDISWPLFEQIAEALVQFAESKAATRRYLDATDVGVFTQLIEIFTVFVDRLGREGEAGLAVLRQHVAAIYGDFHRIKETLPQEDWVSYLGEKLEKRIEELMGKPIDQQLLSVADTIRGHSTHLKVGEDIEVPIHVYGAPDKAVKEGRVRKQTNYRLSIPRLKGERLTPKPYRLEVPPEIIEPFHLQVGDTLKLRVERHVNQGTHLAVYPKAGFDASSTRPIFFYQHMNQSWVGQPAAAKRVLVRRVSFDALDVTDVYYGRKHIEPGAKIRSRVLSRVREGKDGTKYSHYWINLPRTARRRNTIFLPTSRRSYLADVLQRNADAEADIEVKIHPDYGPYLEVSLEGERLGNYWYDPYARGPERVKNIDFVRRKFFDWTLGRKNIYGKEIQPGSFEAEESIKEGGKFRIEVILAGKPHTILYIKRKILWGRRPRLEPKRGPRGDRRMELYDADKPLADQKPLAVFQRNLEKRRLQIIPPKRASPSTSPSKNPLSGFGVAEEFSFDHVVGQIKEKIVHSAGEGKYFDERILPDLKVLVSEQSFLYPVASQLLNEILSTVDTYDQFDWMVYRLFEMNDRGEQVDSTNLGQLLRSVLSEMPDFEQNAHFGPGQFWEVNKGKVMKLQGWTSGMSSKVIKALESLTGVSWEGKHILEIGSGHDDRVIRWFKERGADVIVADASWRAVRLARQDYGVKAVRADILDLSLFREGEFDAVIASSVLYYALRTDKGQIPAYDPDDDSSAWGVERIDGIAVGVFKDDPSKWSLEQADQLIKSVRRVLQPRGLLCCSFYHRMEGSFDNGTLQWVDHRLPAPILESFSKSGLKIVGEVDDGEVLLFQSGFGATEEIGKEEGRGARDDSQFTIHESQLSSGFGVERKTVSRESWIGNRRRSASAVRGDVISSVFKLAKDVSFVIEARDIAQLTSEQYRELVGFVAINEKKLHVLIYGDASAYAIPRVQELLKLDNVHLGTAVDVLPRNAPAIHFGDVESNVHPSRRLDPRVVHLIRQYFGIYDGAFGTALLYAIQDGHLPGLVSVNGFLTDPSSRYTTGVLDELSAYTIVSKAA